VACAIHLARTYKTDCGCMDMLNLRKTKMTRRFMSAASGRFFLTMFASFACVLVLLVV
jgi:hypothetical protein